MKREKQLQQNLYSMLKRTRQEAEIASAAELGSVLVLESAEVSDQPVWPKWRLSLLVGGFVALLLSFAVVAGSEFWRSSFKSQDEAQAEFETRYPLTTFLGVVPAAEIKEGLRLHLITNDIPHTPFSERIRSVRTRLQYLNLKPETPAMPVISELCRVRLVSANWPKPWLDETATFRNSNKASPGGKGSPLG